jgi:MoxR-like ATPase
VEAVLSIEEVCHFQAQRMRVEMAQNICEYIVDLAHATRAHVQVALGVSPRAALALQRAAQASALLDGRAFVTPDDVKKLAPFVWAHRLILLGESSDVRPGEEIVRAVLNDVPVP